MFGSDKRLEGKTVAILATDGFEQSELLEPKKALEDSGAQVKVVSLAGDDIKGWNKGNWGKEVKSDLSVVNAEANKFDALMLPGGVINADKLRTNDDAIEFVRNFVVAGKPIAAICHAPWILIEADAVHDRTLTSWPSLKTDLINAGAHWVDEEVSTDNGLVTSREPSDIPAFNKKMIEEFCEGRHSPVVSKEQSIRDTNFDGVPTSRH